MKKMVSAAAVLAAIGMLSFSAYADETVYVTLVDSNGEQLFAANSIDVSDADGDGTITVNDALITAHKSITWDESKAGYETAEGDYGLMVTKLCGEENGGSYGYYVNNVMACSLLDPITSGDYINAFVFSDTTAFSDMYCYFDKNSYEVTEDGQSVELTLYGASFDADWNPVSVPVVGARIFVDGNPTDAVTDENGKATIIAELANRPITAHSDTQTLVPPAAWLVAAAGDEATDKADDAAAGETAGAVEETPAETADTSATSAVDAASDKGSPATGIADVAVVSGIAVIAAGALVLTRKRK